ncbi:MAG TPA: hypothetical protein VFT91_03415 [Dehalococcoidia bacterium]|nr:hypothetical protein [Dehalococcoidia bacterium]
MNGRQPRRLPVAALATVATLAAAACVGPLAPGPSPRIGDHWHASLAVNLCGVGSPPLADFQGAIDTHGDGVIHIHPRVPADQGKGARLVNFFANAGGVLSERLVQMPGQAPWQDGNVCPGGLPGRIIVVVNDSPLTGEVEDYVPRDGDRIVVAFVPAAGVLPVSPPAPSPVAD